MRAQVDQDVCIGSGKDLSQNFQAGSMPSRKFNAIRDEFQEGNSEHHPGGETEHIADVAKRRSLKYTNGRSHDGPQHHDEKYEDNGIHKVEFSCPQTFEP